jgi:flagellar biosynthetic protein FliR
MQAQLPTGELMALVLASIRAATWLVVSPPFDSRIMPSQVKALLSVAFALPFASQLAGQTTVSTVPEMLAGAVEQVFIGAALGFLTGLFFAAFQAAGDLVDLFGGLTLAFAFDPFSANQSSIFGRFYHLLAVTLLFATGAYELIIRGFMASYQAIPLSSSLSLSELDRVLIHGLPQMFVSAIQIAAPMLAVLFCADVALGLLNKVAPALNVFSLGFPLKILMTLVLAGLAITMLPRALQGVVREAVEAVLTVIHG